MICSIAFCLANLYVNVEVAGPQKIHSMSTEQGTFHEGALCYRHYCSGNPVTLKVGMPLLINDSAVVYYGVKHTSFAQDWSDRGQTTWFVSFTYMPFAR